MISGREEPFKQAMRVIRQRLREGEFAPGRRIAASDLAAGLRLSATPVREALSRLAGEGVLDELRGQGFYVPLYTSADVADLYRLSWAQMRIALGAGRPRLARRIAPETPRTDEDPVGAVERLFSGWVEDGASRVLAGAHRRTLAQLGPLRRLEPHVLPGLGEEAALLAQLADCADPRHRLAPVKRFHQRRIAHAEQLAALAGSRVGGLQL